MYIAVHTHTHTHTHLSEWTTLIVYKWLLKPFHSYIHIYMYIYMYQQVTWIEEWARLIPHRIRFAWRVGWNNAARQLRICVFVPVKQWGPLILLRIRARVDNANTVVVYIYLSLYIYMHICMYVYLYVYVSIYLPIFLCVFVCVCVCVCWCVCAWVCSIIYPSIHLSVLLSVCVRLTRNLEGLEIIP